MGGQEEEQGVPSPESVHANNQSMRSPADESIRIYLKPTYLRLQVAQTNMRPALRLPFASCLMPFLAICKIFAVDWGDLVAINRPTPCPRVIN